MRFRGVGKGDKGDMSPPKLFFVFLGALSQTPQGALSLYGSRR